jgi:hypothetical protein
MEEAYYHLEGDWFVSVKIVPLWGSGKSYKIIFPRGEEYIVKREDLTLSLPSNAKVTSDNYYRKKSRVLRFKKRFALLSRRVIREGVPQEDAFRALLRAIGQESSP